MAVVIDAIVKFFDIGVLDVILPFLLAFIITFAMLEKTKVLGKGWRSRRANAIISFAVGMIFINMFNFRSFMAMVLWFVFVFIVMLMYVLLIETVGIKRSISKLGVFLIFLIFVLIASQNFIDITKLVNFLIHPVVITIVVFGLIFWYVFNEKKSGAVASDDGSGEKGGGKGKESKEEKMKKELNKKPAMIKSIPAEELYTGEKNKELFSEEEEV